jgi:hypothetical protein
MATLVEGGKLNMIYVIYLSTDFVDIYLSNSRSLICSEIRAYEWVSYRVRHVLMGHELSLRNPQTAIFEIRATPYRFPSSPPPFPPNPLRRFPLFAA